MADDSDPAPMPTGAHTTIGFRVSPEFRRWLDCLTARARVGRSVAIEHGLLLLAQQIDHVEPAPKR